MPKKYKRPEGPAYGFARLLVKLTSPFGVANVGRGLTAAAGAGGGPLTKEAAGRSMRGSRMERQATARLDASRSRSHAYLAPPNEPFYDEDPNAQSAADMYPPSQFQGYPPAPESIHGAQYDNYNDPPRGRTSREYDPRNGPRTGSGSPRRSLSVDSSNTYNPPFNDGSHNPGAHNGIHGPPNSGQRPRGTPPSSQIRSQAPRLKTLNQLLAEKQLAEKQRRTRRGGS